jgi:hypothetical protein
MRPDRVDLEIALTLLLGALGAFAVSWILFQFGIRFPVGLGDIQ